MGKSVDRAGQFMPFASLKGYYEQLGEREHIKEPRRELSDDEAEELNSVLCGFSVGDTVRIRCYCDDCYINVEGVVTEIDMTFRRLRIVKRWVNFDDIIEGEILAKNDRNLTNSINDE